MKFLIILKHKSFKERHWKELCDNFLKTNVKIKRNVNFSKIRKRFIKQNMFDIAMKSMGSPMDINLFTLLERNI